MAVLARKVTRAKWDGTDGLADGEIAADAVTADLRTIGNRLSFWTCTTPTDQELKDTVLALATAGDRLDKLDITWLSEQAIHGQGLTLKATDGNTPVASLRNRHIDIEDLDLVRLGTMARLIATALANGQHRRMTKKEVLAIVKVAVLSDLVELEDLKKGVREEVEQAMNPVRPRSTPPPPAS